MDKFVIDSYAWIEYLEGTADGEKVRKIIENRENEIYTCSVTLAEIVSKFARKNIDVNIAINAISSLSKTISADSDLSFVAGKIHAEMKRVIKDFGLSDAYILALSRKLCAKILTEDSHFKNIKEAVFVSKM